MHLVFKSTKLNKLKINIKNGRHIVDEQSLTIGQDFDNMLITTLDKLFIKNNTGRTCLKNIVIKPKINGKSVSGMILMAVRQALEI